LSSILMVCAGVNQLTKYNDFMSHPGSDLRTSYFAIAINRKASLCSQGMCTIRMHWLLIIRIPSLLIVVCLPK
jgi:hypothetical protein